MLDLTAAQIGINKWDWETISSEDEKMAKALMRQKKYDVLPILNSDGTITKYFSTKIWNNYNSLNLNDIQKANTIYYRFSLNDLIRKFNEEKRHYYFLTNGEDILGLVSFINLNCQAVYNYLFQVIADIEQSVASVLKEIITQEEIISEFQKSTDRHLIDILNSFNKSVEEGSDNTIFENMYLQTIGIILKKFKDRIPSKFEKLNNYKLKFSPTGTYGVLRNKVMHPVRPILSDKDSINKIHELLSDYLKIKEVLE